MKDRTLDKAFEARQKELERRHISPLQRNTGAVLIILGILCFIVGAFGYMVGDLQVGVFRDFASQVFIAREAAQSAGTKVSGALDMNGDESGVHVFYASYETAGETGVISAMDFEIEETKKSLKGENIQFRSRRRGKAGEA